jgi:hypothetical protein
LIENTAGTWRAAKEKEEEEKTQRRGEERRETTSFFGSRSRFIWFPFVFKFSNTQGYIYIYI